MSTPMPRGPWNLWAAAVRASTPSSRKLTGILPTAWTASVCMRAPRARQGAASEGEVVCFGSAAGEDDLVGVDSRGVGAEDFADPLARPFERTTGLAAG